MNPVFPLFDFLQAPFLLEVFFCMKFYPEFGLRFSFFIYARLSMNSVPFIQTNSRLCLHCGKCVRDCLAGILTLTPEGTPEFVSGGESRCFRCQHCMAVCPAGAFSFNGKNPADSSLPGPLPEPEKMLNLLRQRRSIRAYRRENVPAEILARLKSAMDYVPTGCNDHRLHFTWADDLAVSDFFREKTAEWLLKNIEAGTLPASISRFSIFKDALENGKDIFFRNAPHFTAISVPPESKDAHIDPYIAASQLELYANCFGLGTCWGGMVTDLFHGSAALLQLLNIPSGWELKIVLLLGIPSIQYARVPQPEPCVHQSLSGRFH